MDFTTIPKKTQLLSLDSRVKTSGTVDNCQFVFGLESNVFMESMKDVIGIKLIEYHVSDLRGNAFTGAYLIDIQIDEVPTRAQMLDTELGKVFARIPIERESNTTNNDIVSRDRVLYREYNTPTRYFNPITLDRLSIRQTQLSGASRSRADLQNDVGWMMVLEITTVDHEAPKPDKLAIAIDKLSDHIKKMPPPQLVMPTEPKKKIPLYMMIIPVAVILGTAYYLKQNKPREPPPVFMTPPIRR